MKIEANGRTGLLAVLELIKFFIYLSLLIGIVVGIPFFFLRWGFFPPVEIREQRTKDRLEMEAKRVCEQYYYIDRRLGVDERLAQDYKTSRELAGSSRIYQREDCYYKD